MTSILIVEDRIHTANRIRKRLVKWGYSDVRVAHERTDAIRIADEWNPDLILMDICLNEKTDPYGGIEAARAIHRRSDIPIVYLTAYHKDAIAYARAKETKPLGFVSKPVDDVILRRTVELALEGFGTGHVTIESDSGSGRSGAFISYCHADEEYFSRLKVHLSPLVDEGLDVWDDTRICPGDDWKREIGLALSRARVGVLLVSPDYLASEFITKVELPNLLAAYESDGLRVLTVYISPCRVPNAVSHIQAINDPARTLVDCEYAESERMWILASELIEAELNGDR